MRDKRILITGALGHIGSGLIHNTVGGQFKEVRLLDNFATQRYSSLFNLPKGVSYDFREGDILTADLVSLLTDIDVVIHLAAMTDAAGTLERREELEEINHKGTKRVAEACIQTGSCLVFPSTTSVYGSQAEVVDENCPLEGLKPQSPYAEFKLISENMLTEFRQEHALRFVILRFGTIFGMSPGMRFHTAVNKFCWEAAMGQPISVWRTALDQKRPYLGLNDAIQSIRLMINKDIFSGELFNVVSSNNTVREIVELITESVPDVTVKFVDSLIMNQLSYEVLGHKVCALGFKPRDNLSTAIKETVSALNGASRN